MTSSQPTATDGQATVAARPMEWQRVVGRDPEMAGASLQGMVLQLAIRAKGAGSDVGALFASQADLMAALQLKKRRVGDLLDKLKDHGYLERIRKGGRAGDNSLYASEYRLTLPSTGTPLHVETGSQPELEHDPTGTPLPIGDGSQPGLEAASTGTPLHVETNSQHALDPPVLPVSRCTEGPPKREVLTPREKNTPLPPESAQLALVNGDGGLTATNRDEMEATLRLFIMADEFLAGDEMPPDIEGVSAAAVASVFVDRLGLQLTASDRRRLVSRLRRIPEDQLTEVVDRASAARVPAEVAHPLRFAVSRLDRAASHVAEFGVPPERASPGADDPYTGPVQF